jgi:uncharacterized protein involved in high-affinity Fe2+ transport
VKQLLILVSLVSLLTACGATASAPKLEVKAGGKEATLDIKSGAVYPSEMSFTAPGKTTMKTSAHIIYLANYELNAAADSAWVNRSMTAPGQVRVGIQLTGEDGSGVKSPFKVGTYSAQAANVNGVRLVKIESFADGKQGATNFDTLMGYGDKKAAGEVKITSVTDSAVSGEVNLTEGDKSVKGTFTASLPKKQ